MQLTQAEFGIYTDMVKHGGLQGGALKSYEGMLKGGNPGLSEASRKSL